MLNKKILGALSNNEQVIFKYKRHPIGLLPIYLSVVSSIGIALFTVTLIDDGGFGESQLTRNIWQIGLAAAVVLMVLIGVVGRYIYWANDLIITNEKVIQILRPSLFKREVAQINLAKIQDVSVKQKGIFQMSFNYGTVVIETAGEVASYSFSYAPKPNEIAATIIEAHDNYLQEHGLTKQMHSGAP